MDGIEQQEKTKKETKTIADFVRESKLGWNREAVKTGRETRTIADFVRESKLGWR